MEMDQQEQCKKVYEFELELYDSSLPLVKMKDGTYAFIDTGSTHCVLNPKHTELIKEIHAENYKLGFAEGSGIMKFCIAFLPLIDMNAYMLLPNSLTVFDQINSDYNIDCSMILGSEFLDTVKANLDFENKKLIIKL